MTIVAGLIVSGNSGSVQAESTEPSSVTSTAEATTSTTEEFTTSSTVEELTTTISTEEPDVVVSSALPTTAKAEPTEAPAEQPKLVGEITSLTLSKESNMTHEGFDVSIEFSIGDGEARGDDYTLVKLPEEIRLQAIVEQKIPLYDAENRNIASATINPEEKWVKIVYNDVVKDLENVKGGLKVTSFINTKVVTQVGKVPLRFTVNNEVEFNREINFTGYGGKYESQFAKGGWQMGNTNRFMFAISVGKNDNPAVLTNKVITDRLAVDTQDNLDINYSTFTVKAGTWKFDPIYGWNLDGETVVTRQIQWLEKDSEGYKIRIPDLPYTGYYIHYETWYVNPVEDQSERMENNATLEADNIETKTSYAKAGVLNMSGWIVGDLTKGSVVVNYISENGEVLLPKATDSFQVPVHSDYDTDVDLKKERIVMDDGREFEYIRTAENSSDTAIAANGKILRVDTPVGKIEGGVTKQVTYVYKLVESTTTTTTTSTTSTAEEPSTTKASTTEEPTTSTTEEPSTTSTTEEPTTTKASAEAPRIKGLSTTEAPKVSSKTKKKLPSTGESSSVLVTLVGLVSLLSLSTFILLKRRNRS